MSASSHVLKYHLNEKTITDAKNTDLFEEYPNINKFSPHEEKNDSESSDSEDSHFQWNFEISKEVKDISGSGRMEFKFEKEVSGSFLTKIDIFNPISSLQLVNLKPNPNDIKKEEFKYLEIQHELPVEEGGSIQAFTWVNSDFLVGDNMKQSKDNEGEKYKYSESKYSLQNRRAQEDRLRKRRRSLKACEDGQSHERPSMDNISNINNLNISNKRQRENESSNAPKHGDVLCEKKKKGKKSRLQKANELLEDSLIKTNICLRDLIPDIQSTMMKDMKDTYTDEEYTKDLTEMEKTEEHMFMKRNFPMMYSKSNFYKNIIMLKDRRNSHKDYFIQQQRIDTNDQFFLSDRTYCRYPTLKKVWKPSEDDNKNTREFFDKYFTLLEPLWPFEICSGFNKEYALEVLMMHDYNIDTVLRKAKESEDLREFLRSKEMLVQFNKNFGDASLKHSKRQRNYMLRRKQGNNTVPVPCM